MMIAAAPVQTTGYVATLADPLADSVATVRPVFDDLKQQGLVTEYRILDEAGIMTFDVPSTQESAVLQALEGVTALTDIQGALR